MKYIKIASVIIAFCTFFLVFIVGEALAMMIFFPQYLESFVVDTIRRIVFIAIAYFASMRLIDYIRRVWSEGSKIKTI